MIEKSYSRQKVRRHTSAALAVGTGGDTLSLIPPLSVIGPEINGGN
jgi:hypothetical protein